MGQAASSMEWDDLICHPVRWWGPIGLQGRTARGRFDPPHRDHRGAGAPGRTCFEPVSSRRPILTWQQRSNSTHHIPSTRGRQSEYSRFSGLVHFSALAPWGRLSRFGGSGSQKAPDSCSEAGWRASVYLEESCIGNGSSGDAAGSRTHAVAPPPGREPFRGDILPERTRSPESDGMRSQARGRSTSRRRPAS
jgi:hypothetical protein